VLLVDVFIELIFEISYLFDLNIFGLHVEDQLSNIILLPLRSSSHLTRQINIYSQHIERFQNSLLTLVVFPKLYQRVGIFAEDQGEVPFRPLQELLLFLCEFFRIIHGRHEVIFFIGVEFLDAFSELLNISLITIQRRVLQIHDLGAENFVVHHGKAGSPEKTMINFLLILFFKLLPRLRNEVRGIKQHEELGALIWKFSI